MKIHAKIESNTVSEKYKSLTKSFRLVRYEPKNMITMKGLIKSAQNCVQGENIVTRKIIIEVVHMTAKSIFLRLSFSVCTPQVILNHRKKAKKHTHKMSIELVITGFKSTTLE